MCVSIPSRITEITPGLLPMALVDVDGRPMSCCLAYVPEAAIGDYVLVQNGFAVDLMDPEAAALSLAAFQELGVLGQVAEPPASPLGAVEDPVA